MMVILLMNETYLEAVNDAFVNSKMKQRFALEDIDQN